MRIHVDLSKSRIPESGNMHVVHRMPLMLSPINMLEP